MSDPGQTQKPWWAKITPTTLFSISVAVVSGGAFLFDRAIGVHDGEEAVQRLVADVRDIEQWRRETDKDRADRFFTISMGLEHANGQISDVKNQVDAIRQQQVQSADAVRNTQADVAAIARKLDITPQNNRSGR